MSEDTVSERPDPTDVGVPMLVGDAKERVGPEDALGPGPKRGDYRDRLGEGISTQIVRDPDGTIRVERQGARAEEIGEVPRRKGGVDT